MSNPSVEGATFTLRAESADVNDPGNFFQGCSFSPDGLCVLTSTAADAKLRLYNTINTADSSSTDDGEGDAVVKDWKTALVSQGGETVRSSAWYPHMNSHDAASCCFVATRRDQPVHLIDAYSGEVRASYRPYNALDEMESPTVVGFSSDGKRIMAGGFRTDRCIHVFDLAVPGRVSTMLRLGKTRRSKDGQKGLISAMTSSSNGKIFCVGTYSPGSLYIYDDRAGQQPSGTILDGVCIVGHGKSHARKKRRFTEIDDNDGKDTTTNDDGQWLSQAKSKWFHARAQGGVTQVQFSPGQDYVLYSASRRSGAVLSWDLRMLSDDPDYQSNPIRGIGSFATLSDTNQRLEFDLDDAGEQLFVGGLDCRVRLYDTKSGDLKGEITNLDDAANGVSFYNQSGKRLLAVATGSRRFPSEDDLDNDADTSSSASFAPPGCLRLFELGRDEPGDGRKEGDTSS